MGALYYGKRAGDNYDYHMWSVRVDTAAGEATTEATSEAAGNGPDSDRPPQETSAKQSGGKSRSEAEAGESTLDDPNGSLPF